MSKYEKYRCICIEDTGLMMKSRNDIIYNRLSKNGITNLQELFEKDDLGKINLGMEMGYTTDANIWTIRGVVRLLRAKYLSEKLCYINDLDLTGKQLDRKCNYGQYSSLWHLLYNMGMHWDFNSAINGGLLKNPEAKLVDVLQNIYLGEIPVKTTKPNYNRNINRIGIILENYSRYVRNLNIQGLEVIEIKYSSLKNISLEDTGIMRNSKKDSSFYRLSKNGIETLRQLFELDDLQNINYGSSSGYMNEPNYFMAKGVVKLLRTRYLKEDFPYYDELEKPSQSFRGRHGLDIPKMIKLFVDMGLHRNFAYSASVSKAVCAEDRIIDILEKVYEGKICITTEHATYETNIRRIGIILEWYYMKKYGLVLEETDDVEELKRRVVRLKDSLINKKEYILAKIMLDRAIFNNQLHLNNAQNYLNDIQDNT